MPPLLTTMKERISPIWKSATLQFERGKQWLTRPRDPIDWKTARARASSWQLPKSIAARALAGTLESVGRSVVGNCGSHLRKG
jgi:hypothetical protein